MATGTWQIYGTAALKIVNGTLTLNTGTFKIGLAKTAYVPDVDLHAFYSDLGANEATGPTQWPVGGIACTITTSKIDASNRVCVIPSDINVATVTLVDGKHAILYKVIGTPATDQLIAYCTWDVALAPSAGTLSIDNDNVNGAFYLTY